MDLGDNARVSGIGYLQECTGGRCATVAACMPRHGGRDVSTLFGSLETRLFFPHCWLRIGRFKPFEYQSSNHCQIRQAQQSVPAASHQASLAPRPNRVAREIGTACPDPPPQHALAPARCFLLGPAGVVLVQSTIFWHGLDRAQPADDARWVCQAGASPRRGQTPRGKRPSLPRSRPSNAAGASPFSHVREGGGPPGAPTASSSRGGASS